MRAFTLRIALESAYALTPEQESDQNWRIWTAEAVASLTQMVTVLERKGFPVMICRQLYEQHLAARLGAGAPR